MFDGSGAFGAWPRQARSAAPVKIVTDRSFPTSYIQFSPPASSSRSSIRR